MTMRLDSLKGWEYEEPKRPPLLQEPAAADVQTGEPISEQKALAQNLKILKDMIDEGPTAPEPVTLTQQATPAVAPTKPWHRKAAAIGDVAANLLTMLGNKREEKKNRKAADRGEHYRPDYRQMPGAVSTGGILEKDQAARDAQNKTNAANVNIRNKEAEINTKAQAEYKKGRQSALNAMLPSLAAAVFRNHGKEDPAMVELFLERIKRIGQLPEDQQAPAMMALITGSSEPLKKRRSLAEISAESEAAASGRRKGAPPVGRKDTNESYFSGRMHYYQVSQGMRPEEAQEHALRDLTIRENAQKTYKQRKLDSEPQTLKDAATLDERTQEHLRMFALALQQYPEDSEEARADFMKEHPGIDPLDYIDSLR